MYLHLGQGAIVRKQDILGIFDLDNTSQSKITQEFLRMAQERGQVVDVSGELPKAFVLCQAEGAPQVYLSQLSSATLLRRSEGMGLEGLGEFMESKPVPAGPDRNGARR